MARRPSTIALAAALCAGGCGTLGSIDIGNARSAYTQVIRRTDDEQLLAMIVHTRYADSFAFLSVASVTSNLTFTSTAGAQFGAGPSANYAGNLVPFSASVAYEENPTISYLPRQGQSYVRLMLAPMPLDLVVLISTAVERPDWVFRVCLQRINGLRDGTDAARAAPFRRVCELMGRLAQSGHLTFTKSTAGGDGLAVALRPPDPDSKSELVELLTLLELDPTLADRGSFELPVLLAVSRPGKPQIDVLTRSPHDLLMLAAAGVALPEEHVREGVALPSNQLPAASAAPLRIACSRTPPDQAAVAIRHRGWWFSIADDDPQSKLGFLLLRSLVLSQLQSEPQAGAPVLTIPVG